MRHAHTIAVPFASYFKPDDVEELLGIMDALLDSGAAKMAPGAVLKDGEAIVVEEWRKCQTMKLPLDTVGLAPFKERIAEAMGRANGEFWKLDLDGFEEPFNLMEYGAGDHFNNWHFDCGVDYTARRKLTFMLQLSDPRNYEGGWWEFRPECNCGEAARAIGSLVVFPAFRAHRATPVIRGVRRTLIGWMSGPELK